MPTAFEEMAGSPVEDFAEAFTATRKLLVAWGSRYSLVGELEYSIYPYRPALIAYARSVSVEPFGNAITAVDGNGLLAYEKALVTVNYSLSSDDPQTVDLVTESIEPNAEFRTLDFEDFRWSAVDGDLLKEDEAASQLLPGHDYIIKFHNLATVPTAVVDLEGFVNAAAFATYTLGRTYAAETLLFGGGTPSRRITSAGVDNFTLTERFHYKADGWNKFFRQATQIQESIYHKTSGIHKNHPLGDFSTLLP